MSESVGSINPPPAFPATVGIFDSGVGGLSVLRAFRKLNTSHPIVYLADQANVPYGTRSLKEVRQLSEMNTRFLLSQGAKVIVLACNTASAAALHHLRGFFPDVPFVGMEPAIKPAAELTSSGVVGVLATPATFQGELYASVVERFGKNVRILQDTCPGLVELIEGGELEGSDTQRILEKALHPMLQKEVDTIVMGCTHYPFVIPLINQIINDFPGSPDVRVIDPAPAIARQIIRILSEHGWYFPEGDIGIVDLFTTSAAGSLFRLLPILLGEQWQVRQAQLF
jgi:glutamate racemase